MDLKLSVIVAFLCVFNVACGQRSVTVDNSNILAQQGSNVWLTCQYSGNPKNLVFENDKVVWKHQAYGSTEFTDILVNGEVVSQETTKFDKNVTTHEQKPGILMQLQVKDVQLEDDGKFVCELRNQDNVVQSSQEVNFLVINPIQRLSLTISKSEDPNSMENVISTQRKNNIMKNVLLDEGKYDVSCVASESNPRPKVSINMGDAKISQDETTVKSMVPGGKRLYQERVTVKQIAINRGTINMRIECIGVVPNANTRAVKGEFRVANVSTKNAMVKCKNSSAILGDLDRSFSCIVTVEQGKIHCSDVVWRKEGSMDETYSHNDPALGQKGVRVECKAINATTLESNLVINRVESHVFKGTYTLIFNNPSYSTITKGNRMTQYHSSATHIGGYISLICLMAAILKAVL